MKQLSDLSEPKPEHHTPLPLWPRVRRATAWLLGVVSMVVLMTWGALHVFIVPRIDDYRANIQQQASQALGVRVQLGHMGVLGGWWAPQFEITEVQLFDAQGREALRLPRVLASVSPLSLLRGQFQQLVIEQPELDIRRDANGQLWVAGLRTQTEGDGSGADWFFSQPEFVLRQGRVRWRDETRGGDAAPWLTLSELSLVMNNHWHTHDLRLDMTPPEALGQRLALRGQFHQAPWVRAGDVQRWSGMVQADLPHVDLATLRQWVTLERGMSLQEGRGALHLGIDVAQGQIVGARADMALDAVNVRLGADLPPLNLRHIRGRLGAKWQDDEGEISSDDVVFDTVDGERWPGGSVRLTWQGADFHAGALSADRLDLEAMAQISQRLPLADTWRQQLARVQPKGQVDQLRVTWHATGQAPTRSYNYKAQGRVRDLHWQHDKATDSVLANVPGISGAQLDFELTQQGGKAQVNIQQGSLTLPAGLDDPLLALDQASAQLMWQLRDDQIALQITQGRVANADLAGEFSGSWHTGEGARRWPGVLDLSATLQRAKVGQVHRYLPHNLPADVRAYVRDAVQQGDASHVQMRLRGNLQDMPFDNPKLGEFRISAQVTRGRYAYVPAPKGMTPASTTQWPALADLNGELVFERSAMRFKGQTHLDGAPQVLWHKVEAHIANLAQAEVQVNGEARGPLAEVLGVVSRSALGELTGKVLDKAQATGNADYKLALKLPLSAIKRSTVHGSVNFQGNELQVMPGTPVLSRTRGVLQFSEQGFSLNALQARALGGDTQLDGGLSFAANAAASPLNLKIKGRLSAEGLRQAREFGLASRLAQHATGTTAYEATLGLRRGQPELQITSDLRGMALGLPAPLNKTAATPLPLRVAMQLTRESQAAKAKVLQDQISVNLGRVLALAYVRDLSEPTTRVLRGGIAVGAEVVDNLPLRERGVSLNLQLPVVDVDAWNAVLTPLLGAPVSPSVAQSATPSLQGVEAEAGKPQDYTPTFLALRAEQLKVTERVIHNVVVGGTRQGELWRLNVGADELNGAVEVRPPSGNTPAQLYARLSYLNIPPSAVNDVERMLSDEPSTIPALDIVVNELTLRGKKLGRLDIEAVNRAGAHAAREWRLNKFNLTMPEAVLTASGSWLTDGPLTRRTQLGFVLDIRDSGQLLTRLGTPDALRDGRGRLEGQVSWQGSPITLDYASMAGKLNLSLEKGQFLKTDPGAARLLGVLNLQSLPRRLTLDFSDLFSDGFAFDFVRGDVRIEQGVAYTNNLQMKGVVAGALLEGSADLAHETQDLKVVVVPEINAGTYSLYMATINPLVGLTSYLAQLVLTKPLVRANTSEFHIDGTWVNPRVTKVD